MMGNSCAQIPEEPKDECPDMHPAANGSDIVTGNISNLNNEESKKESHNKKNGSDGNQICQDVQTNGSEKNYRDECKTQGNLDCAASSTFLLAEGYHLYYKMDNSHRGLAIIFNHHKYKNKDLLVREGTQHDEERLKTILDSLGFDIRSYTDLTFNEILAVVESARKENYKDKDCFILAVLTHGNSGGLLAAYDVDYSFSALLEPFTDYHCPSLKGKPRLFFIQACRGDKIMDPVILVDRTEKDYGPYMSPIPDIAENFLVAYCTMEGYFSWRRSSGTAFIQELCASLEQYRYTHDLNFILTDVLRKVAINFETHTPGNPEMNEKKLMPCVVTKLTRLLRFNKKT